MHRTVLMLSLISAFALVSCKGYKDLEASAFQQMLAGDPSAQLVDVRTPEEFAEGHLPGAANIDWQADDFREKAAESLDKGRPVMVYCRSGKRSAAAAARLDGMGFRTYNLLGGYLKWTEEGRETEVSGNEEPEDLDVLYGADLLKPGTAAPDFTLSDLSGKEVRLSGLRGKTVVLDFWATWCPDCRAEIPALKAMYAAADPSKVTFVSVSYDRDIETLRKYVAENGMPWIQLFDPAGKKDSGIGADYHVKWIPSMYVIGPDGKVVLSTVVASKVAAFLDGK